MQKISKIFVFLSYLYLILPILFFTCMWCNPLVSILGFITILCGTYFLFKNANSLWFPSSKKEWITLVSLLVIACIWVCSSGIGALVFQNSDHECRNFIFELLVNQKSPVIVSYDNVPYIMTYYIGFWLPSVFIAKIFGNSVQLGYYLQVIWATIGVFLVFYYILSFFKNKNILPIIIFIFFSGLDFLGAKLVGFPTNAISHLEWWYPDYQFSSFTTQLYWVFNQAIPAWLVTLVILKEENNKNILCLYSLAFLSATLPAIGMFPIVLYCLYKNSLKNKNFELSLDYLKSFFKSICSYQNIICAFFIVLISLAYLTGNISGSQKALSYFDIFELLKFLLYFFLLEAGLYMILIWKFNKKEPLFYIALISLLIYPFIKVGISNDFCMRATIPALIILFLLIIKTLFYSDILKYKKIFVTLIVCLLIGAITPIHEMTRTIVCTKLGMKKIRVNDSFGSNFFAYADNNLFYKYLGKHNH